MSKPKGIREEFVEAFEEAGLEGAQESAYWAARWTAEYLAGQLESIPRANDRIRQLAKELGDSQ